MPFRRLLFRGVLAFLLAGRSTTYAPLLYLFNEPVDYEEREDAVFRGRVVDAETGALVDRSTAVWATQRYAPIDTLGATESYERINQVFKEEEKEAFIFDRSRVHTDRTGHFQIERERRLYSSPHQTEASFRRIVVEKEGDAPFSQGMLSTCEYHLDALPPVRLARRP